jgi:phage terminase small subunit
VALEDAKPTSGDRLRGNRQLLVRIVELRMPAGRPPKPIQLHRIEGTFRPDRDDSRVEPEAPGLLNKVRPPTWMSKRQRQLWSEILADASYGLLRRIDRQLLVNYVELVERHERAAIAQSKLDATGRRRSYRATAEC